VPAQSGWPRYPAVTATLVVCNSQSEGLSAHRVAQDRRKPKAKHLATVDEVTLLSRARFVAALRCTEDNAHQFNCSKSLIEQRRLLWSVVRAWKSQFVQGPIMVVMFHSVWFVGEAAGLRHCGSLRVAFLNGGMYEIWLVGGCGGGCWS
jgi:hypothetical protein